MKQTTRSLSPSPEWLTLGQAARILGVHPTTLRRWTDEKVIRCVRTPGGHRRFLQRDLDAFLEARTQSHSVEVPKTLARAIVRQARHDMRTEQIADAPWHSAFNEAECAARRKSGRHLLGLAIQFTSRSTGHEAVLQEAVSIGRQYGRDAADRGLSLVDTTRALMFFREALISAARPGLTTRGEYDSEDVRIHRSLRKFLDQVFFATMDGYEEQVQLWPAEGLE